MSDEKVEVIIVTPKHKRNIVSVKRFPVEPSPARSHLVREGSRAVRKLNFDASTDSTDPK